MESSESSDEKNEEAIQLKIPYHGVAEVLSAVRNIIATKPLGEKNPMSAMSIASNLQAEGMARFMARRLFSQRRKGAVLQQEWRNAFEEQRFAQETGFHGLQSIQLTSQLNAQTSTIEPDDVSSGPCAPSLPIFDSKNVNIAVSMFTFSEIEIFSVFNDDADSLGMGEPFYNYAPYSTMRAPVHKMQCPRRTRRRQATQRL